MENVEWNDVQGLVQSGFAYLPSAAYILWRFNLERSAQERKKWLGDVADRLIRVEIDAEANDLPCRPRSLTRLKAIIDEAKKLSGETNTLDGRKSQQIDVGERS